MDRIRDLYSTLSKAETRHLKQYLTNTHSKGENKSLHLLQALDKHPDWDNQAMASFLYGHAKSKAFIMLKSRLMDKMLEFLSFNATIQNSVPFKHDPDSFVSIQLHKQIANALILQHRGLYGLAQDYLRKTAKEAEEAALPSLTTEALFHLRRLIHGESEDIIALHSAISSSSHQHQTDLMGSEFHDSCLSLVLTQSRFDSSLVSLLKDQIQGLELQLKQAYSLQGHFYYLSLQIFLSTGMRAYEQGKELGLELMDLVQTHQGLSAKSWQGMAYIHLARLELGLHHYEAGRQAAALAIDLFLPRNKQFLWASLPLTYACLLLGDLTRAQAMMENIDWLMARSTGKDGAEIALYLTSCRLYMEGKVREAKRAMLPIKHLYKDKDGWNSALRIHEILLVIELGDNDTAIAKIEALRKHLAKYPGGLRTELIFRYLTLLERQSFQVREINEEMQDILTQLSGETTWNPIGTEMIRFDVWIQAKANRRSYYPLFLDTLEAERNQKS